MVDFAKLVGWREPVEVYLAAFGDTNPLAIRILKGEPFDDLERRSMAHYLRGELKPPKRKRGQKRLSYLTTLEDVHESIMQDAVLDYHHIMSEVQKEYGSKYNVKFKAVEYVADRDGIDYEALLNRINRPKNNGEISGVDNVPHAVRLFHKWLHRTGRLRNYPRYVGSGALVKAGILATRQADREKDKAD